MEDGVIVRISKGSVPLDHLEAAEEALATSEHALRTTLASLPGLVHYYVAIDRTAGQVTNVSVWATAEHAHAMDTLPEMLAQRPILEATGVTFEPITNHETLWTITP
jgi:hypothetical protein